MPGPNSQPNGDGSLVRGSHREKFVLEIYTTKDGKAWRHISKREWLLKQGKLVTGKTAAKRG